MHVDDMDLTDVVFTHMDEGTKAITTINISRLLRDWKVRMRPVVMLPIDRDFAKFCVTNRGVEEHRLERLEREEIREPVLFAYWQSGEHLLIDGTHRYVAQTLKGASEIKARILPISVWRPYVIEGIPNDYAMKMMHGFSGIA